VRYIVIGAGAVGGTIGGCLFQGGHDVVLVARGAHLEALRTHGLRLATPLGTDVLPIPAVSGPAEVALRRDDVLILATKTQDAEAVLTEWARQPVADGPSDAGDPAGDPADDSAGASGIAGTVAAEVVPVVCAQNGVTSERFALRRFRHVYGMHVWLPATHLEPGAVESQGVPFAGMLQVGRYPAGIDPTAERIGADLEKSRFLSPVRADVMRWKYSKLLDNLNNAIEALCGPEHTGFGAAPRSSDAADLYRLTRAEGTAVLDAAGLAYASRPELKELRGDRVRIESVNGSARSGGSSWQSLTRRTGTIEADFLNGEIVLLGRLHGIPTPVNEALQRLANQAAAQRRAPGFLTPGQVLAAAGVGDRPGR
jgi:2-dehydropantoate 2-reductase